MRVRLQRLQARKQQQAKQHVHARPAGLRMGCRAVPATPAQQQRSSHSSSKKQAARPRKAWAACPLPPPSTGALHLAPACPLCRCTSCSAPAAKAPAARSPLCCLHCQWLHLCMVRTGVLLSVAAALARRAAQTSSCSRARQAAPSADMQRWRQRLHGQLPPPPQKTPSSLGSLTGVLPWAHRAGGFCRTSAQNRPGQHWQQQEAAFTAMATATANVAAALALLMRMPQQLQATTQAEL